MKLFVKLIFVKLVKCNNNCGKSVNLLCDKSNCKIRIGIELDDYSHNNNNALKNDNFKNEIFKQTDLPLIRIKVNNTYNLEKLKQKIKESI